MRVRPAGCFFQVREGSNLLLLRYVHPLGCLFNQTSRFLFWWRRPRGIVAFSLMQGVKPLHVPFSRAVVNRQTALAARTPPVFPQGFSRGPERAARPLGCLFNQTSRFVFRRSLRRLQRRGGGFFGHAEGQTSACSLPMSRSGC